MGNKYSLPEKIQEKDLKQFFLANDNVLLKESLKTNKLPVSNLYKSFLISAREINYFNYDEGDFDTFQSNTRKGLQEYMKNPLDRNTYDKNYNSNNKENMELLHKRNSVKASPVALNIIKPMLQKNLEIECKQKDPFFKQNKSFKKFNMADSLSYSELLWDAKLTEKFSIWGWFYGYHKILIEKNNNFSYAWVSKKSFPGSMVMPIGHRHNIILTNKVDNLYTQKLIHELTHAIQFTEEPFWKWDETLVEIPSIAAERKIMGDFPPETIRKQCALAVADIDANNAAEFNKLYEKYSGFKNVGCVSAKMWQYYAYPKTYYRYPLSMVLPLQQSNYYSYKNLHKTFTKTDQKE
jgi:hypothetical protein